MLAVKLFYSFRSMGPSGVYIVAVPQSNNEAVYVPEQVFSDMDKVDYFNPSNMKKKVSSLFSSLRDAFAQLPAIQKLQNRFFQLKN